MRKAAPSQQAPRPIAVGPAGATATGRYGEDRGPNLPAAGLALLMTGLLLAMLVAMNVRHERVEMDRLVVVDLAAAPPPAPPPPDSTPPQPQTPVVVPQPPVVLQNNPPPVPAVPDIVPQPVKVTVSPPPPSPPAPPVTVQASDLGTRMISGAAPRYPRESRRHREEGTVVLSLTLDPDGSVASISVARSSGFDRLDEAALRAVRHWRWAPTMRGGQAVAVSGLVEIPFVLRR